MMDAYRCGRIENWEDEVVKWPLKVDPYQINMFYSDNSILILIPSTRIWTVDPDETLYNTWGISQVSTVKFMISLPSYDIG